MRLDDIQWRKNPAAADSVSKAADSASSPAIDVAKRQATFILSTSSVDRYGDTIDQNGWELDNFKKNPVVLCNHNSWSLPIGKCVQVGVEAGQLKGTVEFATTEDAEDVWKLVQAGVLRSASVGFKPKEYTEDAERRGPWGWPALNFKKQELLEWSVVGIPANPDCLLDDQAKSALERVTKSMGQRRNTPDPVEARLAQLEKAVLVAERVAKAFGLLDPEPVEGETKGAVHKLSAKQYARAKAGVATCSAMLADHHAANGAADGEPDGDEGGEGTSDGDGDEPAPEKSFEQMTKAELGEALKDPKRAEAARAFIAEQVATAKRKATGKLD